MRLLKIILGLKIIKNVYQYVGPKLGVLIAAGFTMYVAYYEYYLAKQGARVETTLQYIDSWQSTGVRQHYSRLAEALAVSFSEVDDASIQRTKNDPFYRQKLFKKITDRLLRQDKNSQAFDEIFYFFNSIGLCLHGGICDGATVKLFFGTSFEQFDDYFTSQIEEHLLAYPGYQTGILALRQLSDAR